MDGNGLLAGVSKTNDDYRPGVEPKWLETQGMSSDTLQIGRLKSDESARPRVPAFSEPGHCNNSCCRSLAIDGCRRSCE